MQSINFLTESCFEEISLPDDKMFSNLEILAKNQLSNSTLYSDRKKQKIFQNSLWQFCKGSLVWGKLHVCVLAKTFEKARAYQDLYIQNPDKYLATYSKIESLFDQACFQIYKLREIYKSYPQKCAKLSKLLSNYAIDNSTLKANLEAITKLTFTTELKVAENGLEVTSLEIPSNKLSSQVLKTLSATLNRAYAILLLPKNPQNNELKIVFSNAIKNLERLKLIKPHERLENILIRYPIDALPSPLDEIPPPPPPPPVELKKEIRFSRKKTSSLPTIKVPFKINLEDLKSVKLKKVHDQMALRSENFLENSLMKTFTLIESKLEKPSSSTQDTWDDEILEGFSFTNLTMSNKPANLENFKNSSILQRRKFIE